MQKSERFEVLTDHRALVEYFMTTKVLKSRQASWAEKISRFYFVIRYRPGKNYALADALSRRQDVVNYQNEAKKKFRTQTLLLEECLDPQIVREFKAVELTVSVVTLQDNPHIVDKLLQANRTNQPYREKARGPDKDWAMQDGLLLYNSRLVVPNDDELKVKLTDEAHKQASTAHPGRLKTTKSTEIQILLARHGWIRESLCQELSYLQESTRPEGFASRTPKSSACTGTTLATYLDGFPYVSEG